MLRTCLLTPLIAAAAAGEAAAFPGWSRMAVIRIGDGCEAISVADLGGAAGVLVANRRQARIDLLQVDPAAPGDPPAAGSEAGAVNRLVLPKGFRHVQLPCPAPPLDAVAAAGGIVAIHGPPWRATRWARGADGAWAIAGERDLLDGEPERRLRALRLDGDAGVRLLIGCADGVQALPVAADGALGKPEWLRPRTRGRGLAWGLADLDGDGAADLVEAFAGGNGLRWSAQRDGTFAPPQSLREEPLRGLALLPAARGGATLALLAPHQQESAGLFRLAAGAPGPLAGAFAIPLPSQAPVAGARLAGVACLAVAAPGEGRIDVHRLADGRDGPRWSDGGGFPAPRGIKAMAAPAADLLLLWVEGQADLLACRWQDGRLSYPQPWRPPGDAGGADRMIVGLDGNGRADWWFQRQGEDLVLWIWDGEAPRAVRFAGAGAKIGAAQWLGGERAVVRQGFSADAELLIAGAPAVRRTAAQVPLLAKFDPAKARLIAWGDGMAAGRIADGDWQWLGAGDGAGEELSIRDQIDAGDDEIADLADLGARGRWAVAGRGRGLVRLDGGPGGLLVAGERRRIGGGDRLRHDRWLGPLLVGGDAAWILHDGAPWRLAPAATADVRAFPGPSTAQASRIAAAPAASACDLFIHDDPGHRLLLYAGDGRGLAAWPVFDDRGYPYGNDGEGRKAAVAEPRAVAGGDLDGDRRSDLALICHDRIILYLTGSRP